MRVVSLIPSATEILALLGAADSLVGRSHECDHPPRVSDVPALTAPRETPVAPDAIDRAVARSLESGQGLYHLDGARLRELAPDLIITQDLCAVCAVHPDLVHEAIAGLTPPPVVLNLRPGSLEDVYDDVLRVGEVIGRAPEAQRAVVRLRERFHEAADYVNPYTQPINTLFLEWTDPPFVGGHWTAQLVERAGAVHPLNPTRAITGSGSGAGAQMAHRVAGKSIRVTPEAILESAPDAIVIAPCGVDLPNAREHAGVLAHHDWFRSLPASRSGRIALVDGNQMFNRPGPRLVDAYRWLVGWLNNLEHLIPEGFPWEPYDSAR